MTRSESSGQATKLTTGQTLQQAVAHHQAGRLQDAERLYRAILQTQPHHPDANHNLGVIAVQMKQPAAGLPHFKAALEANLSQEQFWLSYIDALIQAGQSAAARQVLEQGRQHGLQGKEAEVLMSRLEALAESAPDPQETHTLVALFTGKQYTEAATLAQTLTQRFPRHGFGWKVLGAAFKQLGQNADALAAMQKAAALSPHDPEAHYNLGIAFANLDRLDEAENSYRRALQIKPDFAKAHSNLGNTLKEMGRLEEAEASYRQALEAQPDLVEVHSNLGNVLHNLGRLGEAEACHRRALQIKPDYVEAHHNLGVTLEGAHRLDEAEASYRRTLEIKPDFAEALNSLALLFNVQGQPMAALNTIQKSLRIKETEEAKGIFIGCVKRRHCVVDDSNIRAAMLRALTEPWGRPMDIARYGIELTRLHPDIGTCVARAAAAWPSRLPAQDLFGANGFAADPLLRALLDAVPICDIELERFLTMARRALLDAASGVTTLDGAELGFYSALARQCFINEYVFSHTADEIRQAGELRDSLLAALDAGAQTPALSLVAVAAYFPLYTLPQAARLLERQWPAEVAAVLVQQVGEPEEERQLRASLPRLTDIEDEVSLLVQNQYEENPYPRWVKSVPAGKTRNIVGYLRQQFPLSSYKGHGKDGSIDILIAGCGTGQHSIGTAQRYQGARVLAIDLSASSLGYAKRKTHELGLTSIEYAQADLLKLGSINRSFDVIESSGVLHHLADPWAGWRVLLSLLRPGGFMKLGFYSEVARRDIVRIRSFIAENGYGSTPDEIRRCRQDLVDLDKSACFGATLKSPDFFSISACRDLLFHVQEHRMTLTGISAFLRENHLTFLGFDTDANVLHAYKRRFPDDQAATNMDQWQIFENENPGTFSSMYQFWIQKAD